MSNQDEIAASILITNYNGGELLRRSLQSAFTQDYSSPYEVIVVDDGSTDNSREIVDEMCQTHLVSHTGHTSPNLKNCATVYHKTNQGIPKSRNAALEAARGHIVAWLDSDDKYMPNKLQVSTNYLVQYPGVGCVYSDYFEHNKEGKGEEKRVYKPPFDAKLLMQNCIVSCNSVLFKKVYEKIGEYDNNLPVCEDYDVWMRIVNAGFSIRHIPMPLFHYYHHGSNVTDTYKMERYMEHNAIAQARARTGQFYWKNN
jgi:glycosyltransferase involved in cell wall biosynthesis